jgi:hypothetical protein
MWLPVLQWSCMKSCDNGRMNEMTTMLNSLVVRRIIMNLWNSNNVYTHTSGQSLRHCFKLNRGIPLLVTWYFILANVNQAVCVDEDGTIHSINFSELKMKKPCCRHSILNCCIE